MIRDEIIEYKKSLAVKLDTVPPEVIEKVIRVISEAYRAQRSIFVFGNGGSAASASHFACDLNKCVSYGLKKRFKVICLNDSVPTLLAYANDVSYDDVFVEQLKNLLKPGDVVIGISCSGNSKNVLKAIAYANKKNARTVALTGFKGGRLRYVAGVTLVVPGADMQQTEDIHLIVLHTVMRVMYTRTGGR